MAKQIILTADDFGACDYINEGIYTAIEKRKINTVSVFVTHLISKSSIENLIKFRDDNNYDFNIGLHFSINSGHSLLNRKSSLTNKSGGGYHYFKKVKKYKFNKIKLNDIEEELIAQLKKLDDILEDTPIDHISNHCGLVYIDIDFFNRFIKTIKNYNNNNKYNKPIPIRSPISWLKSMGNGIISTLSAPTVRQGIKLGMSKKFFALTRKKLEERKDAAQKLNIKFPDYLVDIIYGQATTNILEGIVKDFKNNEISAELMFHLGKGNDDPDLIPHGINRTYYSKREKELDVLLSWDLQADFQKYGISKVGFNQLS